MRTEYKFERGNLSQQSDYLAHRLIVKVGRVTYVYFDDERIGWIPAKEGVAKDLLSGSYSGYLTDDGTISVEYAKSDLIAEQDKSLGDFSMETCINIPINKVLLHQGLVFLLLT